MGKNNLSICLVSGGMDSCVTAAIAREENREIAFLHISYGQRTKRRDHLQRSCAAFGEKLRRLVIPVS